jgi:hypothetical protein
MLSRAFQLLSAFTYYGTIYKIGKDGSGYSVLRSFLGTGGDGDTSGTGLLLGSNGIFWRFGLRPLLRVWTVETPFLVFIRLIHPTGFLAGA